MTTTIMFTNEKGGVGKTTLSTLAAAVLAARGFDVVMVDFDMQAHATISYGLEKIYGLYNVMVRNEDVNAWLYDVDPTRYCPPGHVSGGCLRVLPSNEETARIEVYDDDVLFEALSDITPAPDYVIIDTAPSSGVTLRNAWYASDSVVIPAKMEFLSLDGVMNTARRASKSGTRILGIVPNMYQAHTNIHQHNYNLLRQAAQEYGWHVFNPIGHRVAWTESSSVQHMIISLEGEVGKARAESLSFVGSLLKQLGVVANG